MLLCESTYGDREHEAGDPAAMLADIVNRVVKRGGSIVIPAFAIGRTQTFMYYLRQLEDEKKIPVLPVYVDSPMALSATDLYVKYKEDHDLDFARLESSGDGDPLNVHEFHLTRSAEESKAINNVKTPCIIVSASGMVSGGRVLHHLAQRLPDAKNAVLLAGFQAEGTRGRALQEGAKAAASFRAGGSGERRDHHHGPTFRACGKKRTAALARRIAVGTEKDVADARRAGGGTSLASRHQGEISMGCGGGAIPGHRRTWVSSFSFGASRQIGAEFIFDSPGNFSAGWHRLYHARPLAG